MKSLPISLLAPVALLFCGQLLASPGPLRLYYDEPAVFRSGVTSHEALPIGNGKIAGMVYGGVEEDVFQFNEDTVWAGAPNDYSNPGASEWLDAIREHVWRGEGEAAWDEAAADHFMSVPLRQSPYVGTGSLHFDFAHGDASDYSRILDLETATAAIEYTADGVTYRRETFASFPDRVVVMRFTASEPGSISFDYTFGSLHTRRTVAVEGTDLVMDAQVNDDTNSRRQKVSEVEFQARVRIQAEGGSVTPGESSVTVEGADAVTLIFHVATNFVRFDELGADPEARAVAAIEAASAKSFEALREAHLADYQELFDRFEIDLGSTELAQLPTDERLERLKDSLARLPASHVENGVEDFTAGLNLEDPDLVALNVQMARYLMIAGSRPGSQPLNLQGKWSNELDPSWESKMTLNINQEMNYWAAEMANLAETHVPMVDLVRDLSISGAKVAEEHYDARGWMVHHNTDLWRGAAPINSPGGMWPTGSAWLSMHLWWHYEYSRDEEYLAEIYPLLKSAAEFYEDFLVMDPRSPDDSYPAWDGQGHPQWGKYLLTNPSHSPERPNSFLDDNGELVAGPMIDNQLLRAFFGYVIEASDTLGVDADFRERLEEMRSLLPPNMIGKHGQLQEWLEDVDMPENPATGGHRHLSHMIDVFPGEGIHPIYEPEFADAARVVLDWKGDPSNNTSWSRAWKMNLRTALLEGDHAFMILMDVLARSHTPNMTFSNKGNGEDQIDGNMGVLMGTLQFFMQSRRGEIHLLPALPTKLPSGAVRGIRAKDGFELDIAWEGGQLTSATLRSALGNRARIRSEWPLMVRNGDEAVTVETVGENLYEFATEAGAEYTLANGNLRTWAGYPVDGAGRTDTGAFLGELFVEIAPWLWSYDLASWIYVPEELIFAGGAWAYVHR